MKKDKKIKVLEEENRRLKVLLKSQLDTSDKLKIETYSTVEALKSEFQEIIDGLHLGGDKRRHDHFK